MSVIFLRHGEKPKKGVDLSKEGYERAYQLPKFFKDSNLPHPDLILAMKQASDHSSNRPYETVKYLASSLSLVINIEYTRDEIHKVIDYIKEHRNKNILIVWEHLVLTKIINKITGVDIKWHDDDYESVYIWLNGELIHKNFVTN